MLITAPLFGVARRGEVIPTATNSMVVTSVGHSKNLNEVSITATLNGQTSAPYN